MDGRTEAKKKSFIYKIFQFREKSSIGLIYFLLIIVTILAGVVSPGFLALGHIMDITKQATPLVLVSLGQSVVMLTGNVSIDLSVESVIVLTNVICTTLFTRTHISPFWIIMILIGMAVGVGVVNGIGITVFRIEPFIMTLGTMIILQGVALIISGGTPGGMVPKGVVEVVRTRLFGVIPLVTILWVVFAIFLYFILARTTFGRKIYLVGNNWKVAFLSGINPSFIKVTAYVICATLAMIAGLELTGYIGTGSVIIGSGYSFLSITAAVIGGISFTGGIGNILGTLGGALIMTIILSLLTAVNIPQAGRYVLQGAAILGFVTIYSLREKERR